MMMIIQLWASVGKSLIQRHKTRRSSRSSQEIVKYFSVSIVFPATTFIGMSVGKENILCIIGKQTFTSIHQEKCQKHRKKEEKGQFSGEAQPDISYDYNDL
jgi:hypothetical protein